MMKGIKESTKVTKKDKKEITKITKVLKDLGKSKGSSPHIGWNKCKLCSINLSCSSMLAIQLILVGVEGKKKEERKDVLEAKVAEGVIRYIEMKEGGHFQYGMSFIASQVISRF